MKLERIKNYLENFFWLISTYFLALPFYILIFLRTFRRGSRQENQNPLKILAIHTGKIGDLVNATPILREIKQKIPPAHLTTLVISKAAGVLRNNPRIDKIMLLDNYGGVAGRLRLLWELRKGKYDWAFNIFPDSFTNIIAFWSLVPNRVTTTYKYSGKATTLLSIFNNYRLEYKRHSPLTRHLLDLLKFIGIKEPSDKRELFVTPAEGAKVSDFLKEHNLNENDLLVGISVTAGVKIKEWEPQKFASLADKFIGEKNAKIIFVGGGQDVPRIEKVQKMMRHDSINAAGQFELRELPALLKKLKLFISVDTGPLCIAVALGIPAVDIAGPIDLTELYPLNARSKIIQKQIYCVPCGHMFDAPRFCKEKHFRCLREITVGEVFEAAAAIINNF